MRPAAAIVFVAFAMAASQGHVWAQQCTLMAQITPLASNVEFGTIVGAVFNTDSTVVVADAQASALHLFTVGGRHIATAGRRGAGPGEFRSLSSVMMSNGNVTAYDGSLRRVSRFDSKLQFMAIDSPGFASGRLFGYTRDRGAVTSDPQRMGANGRNGPESFTDSIVVRLNQRDGAPQVLIRSANQTKVVYAHRTFDVMPAPFSHAAVISVGNDVIAFGDRTRIIRRFDGDGKRLEDVVLPWQQQTLRNGDYEKWSAYQLDQSQSKAEVRALLDAAPKRPRAPGHGAIVIDRNDVMWVQQYAAPYESIATRVIAADARGRLIGTGTLPPRTHLLAAAPNALLVSTADEFDVPTIGVMGIRCTR